jgi:hypothetical protein
VGTTSQSERIRETYEHYLLQFRATFHAVGLELDGLPLLDGAITEVAREQAVAALALAAQGWAGVFRIRLQRHTSRGRVIGRIAG